MKKGRDIPVDAKIRYFDMVYLIIDCIVHRLSYL